MALHSSFIMFLELYAWRWKTSFERKKWPCKESGKIIQILIVATSHFRPTVPSSPIDMEKACFYACVIWHSAAINKTIHTIRLMSKWSRLVPGLMMPRPELSGISNLSISRFLLVSWWNSWFWLVNQVKRWSLFLNVELSCVSGDELI